MGQNTYFTVSAEKWVDFEVASQLVGWGCQT